MFSRTRFGRYLAALLVVAPGTALADPPAQAPAPAAPAAPKETPKPAAPAATSGAPAGVTPAPAKTAAAAPATAKTKGGFAGNRKKKKKGDEPITGPVATYAAFRMLDGGASRVSVALSKKVGITEQKAKGKVSYRIQGMQVPTRTNRLPLLTTFFTTPVSRVELVQQGGDVDLVIDLRTEAAPQFRIVETDRGAELQVDFPEMATDEAAAGTAATAAPAADVPTGRPATTKSIESQTNSAY